MGARRDVAAAAAYAAAMLLFVYGVANTGALPDTSEVNAAALAALVAVHLATGLVGGRWWLVALPVVAVVLAVPAGLPEATDGEPLPIWFGLAIVSPIAAALIAIGVAAHKLVGRRAAT